MQPQRRPKKRPGWGGVSLNTVQSRHFLPQALMVMGLACDVCRVFALEVTQSNPNMSFTWPGIAGTQGLRRRVLPATSCRIARGSLKRVRGRHEKKRCVRPPRNLCAAIRLQQPTRTRETRGGAREWSRVPCGKHAHLRYLRQDVHAELLHKLPLQHPFWGSPQWGPD